MLVRLVAIPNLSTPSDLVRFGMAINGGTLLQADTVRKLQTPQVLTSGKETRVWGYP